MITRDAPLHSRTCQIATSNAPAVAGSFHQFSPMNGMVGSGAGFKASTSDQVPASRRIEAR